MSKNTSKKNEYPKPSNFPYDNVFFDDGNISIMCGKYKDNKHYSLGMRWNISESELGFPNSYGQSMWMVVPKQLAIYILEGILSDCSQEKNIIDKKKMEHYLELLKSQKK